MLILLNKRGMMKHQIYIYLSFFLVTFFALLSVENPESTGAAITETEDTYAYTLNHIINNNLGTYAVQFPTGSCADTAAQLYDTLAATPLEVTAGYSTLGKNKVASINFGMERSLGSVDIVTGELTGLSEDAFVSIETHTTIRMPPGVARLTSLNMDLYGYNLGTFRITRGSFSTPSLDCEFTTNAGNALCECRAHPPERSTVNSWTEA